jgi:ubiquitin carboxyl-terminal hydrolase 36/42
MKAEGMEKSGIFENNDKSTHDSDTSSLVWFEDSKAPPVTQGLHNLGNTCYLNSVVQVLLNTPAFINQSESVKGSSGGHHTCLPTGPSKICYTCETLRLCSQSRRKTASPNHIVDNLKFLNKRFSRGRQQDSHEFFLLLLNRLDDKMRNPFKGTITSSVKCKRNHISATSEEFLNLTLDIWQLGSIGNALKRHFAESGVIKGYLCGGCKSKVDITKKYDWKDMPGYLVLHLNRFDRFANKIGTHIDFDFDMNVNGNDYTLYGVVEHLGSSIDFGHYIAYVMSSRRVWFRVG